MSIFSDLAPRYEALGHYVIPTNPVHQKNPAKFTEQEKKTLKKSTFPRWQHKETKLSERLNFASKTGFVNIGLVLGPEILAIDIDTDILPDEVSLTPLQLKLKDLAPKSDFVKVGRRSRETRYFKGHPKINKKSKIDGFGEILTGDAYTIMPGSMHGDGHEVVWMVDGTPIKFRDDFLVENLPDLPENFEDILAEIERLAASGIAKGQIVNNWGRNEKLKKHVVAKIADHKDPIISIQELIQEDKKLFGDNCLFEDKTENKGRDHAYTNAARFYFSNAASMLSGGDVVYDPRKIEINTEPPPIAVVSNDEAEIIQKEKQIIFKNFMGLGKEVQQVILDRSFVKRKKLAVGGTLSFLSMIAGGYLSFDYTHPNVCILLVTISGKGKDSPLKTPHFLLSECDLDHLIGQKHGSGESFIQAFDVQPHRLDIRDEAQELFKQIGGSGPLATYADQFNDIFSSPFKKMPGICALKRVTPKNPTGVMGTAPNPYISLTQAMTIEAFQDHFNAEVFNYGMGRRLWFFYDKSLSVIGGIKGDATLDPQTIEKIKAFRELGSKKLGFNSKWMYSTPLPLKFNRETTQKNHEEIVKILTNEIIADEMADSGSIIAPLIGAKIQNLSKLLILSTFEEQFDKPIEEMAITNKNIEWAHDTNEKIFEVAKMVRVEKISTNDYEKNFKKISGFIKDAGLKGVSKTDIHHKFTSMGPKSRDVILKDLEDAEYVFSKRVKTSEKAKKPKVVFIDSIYIKNI